MLFSLVVINPLIMPGYIGERSVCVLAFLVKKVKKIAKPPGEHKYHPQSIHPGTGCLELFNYLLLHYRCRAIQP